MKNILVPTDFSKCSKYAVDAAVLLAKRFGAKVHLLNSLDLPPYWSSLPEQEKSKWATVSKATDEARKGLEQLKAGYPGAHLELATSADSLPRAVEKYVSEKGIDIIVMGSHGASGKSEFFIGSNTQKVIRTVHCPALVLKQPLKSADFKKVIFASSFNKPEMKPFLFFKNLIKHFIPEIHLVAIHTSAFDPPFPFKLEAMKPFEQACRPLVCHSHIYKDLSVDNGIRSFANEIGADLIAISNYERRPLKRMLVGSNVEALVNHSDLPVLTVDFSPVQSSVLFSPSVRQSAV